MAGECLVSIYNEFNDRGAISDRLGRTIPIDAKAIEKGEDLPFWAFDGPVPAIAYYDGECLDISYDGRILSCRAWGESIEILRFLVPNGQVKETVRVEIRLVAIADIGYPDHHAMFIHGSFNVLIRGFLHTVPSERSKVAISRFLWTLKADENLFLLDGHTIKALEESSAGGDSYAMYGLGRYHYLVRPGSSSCQIAGSCLHEAYDQGIADAGACLSMMYRFGDMGPVDMEQADRLFNEAMDKGSRLALYAHLRYLVFGIGGKAEDPEEAICILDGLIGNDDDPSWHLLRGWALQAAHSISAAGNDYEEAAHGGRIAAWLGLAVTVSYDDDGNLLDRNGYLAALDMGIAHRDCQCLYLKALSDIEGYDEMPAYRKAFRSAMLVAALEKAYDMGSAPAAETLGDIYRNGWYGNDEDLNAAYDWYRKAARLYSPTAYESLFDMMRSGEADADPDVMDRCVLEGARLGSEMLQDEAIAACSQGRLLEYADEIARYNAHDPDYADDDGHYDAYV